MKTLELENYGVQEMSMNELREVDGGLSFPEWGAILSTLAIIALIILL